MAEALPNDTSLETLLPIETILNRWDIRLEVSLWILSTDLF